MVSALPTFPPFNSHETALDIHWCKWIKRLENLLVGMDVKDKKCLRALLLHYAEEDVSDIFETLTDMEDAGLGGSVGCAVRLETRRSRVQPPPRSATFFRGQCIPWTKSLGPLDLDWSK